MQMGSVNEKNETLGHFVQRCSLYLHSIYTQGVERALNNNFTKHEVVLQNKLTIYKFTNFKHSPGCAMCCILPVIYNLTKTDIKQLISFQIQRPSLTSNILELQPKLFIFSNKVGKCLNFCQVFIARPKKEISESKGALQMLYLMLCLIIYLFDQGFR